MFAGEKNENKTRFIALFAVDHRLFPFIYSTKAGAKSTIKRFHDESSQFFNSK